MINSVALSTGFDTHTQKKKRKQKRNLVLFCLLMVIIWENGYEKNAEDEILSCKTVNFLS